MQWIKLSPPLAMSGRQGLAALLAARGEAAGDRNSR
jgi:hypothetical protein